MNIESNLINAQLSESSLLTNIAYPFFVPSQKERREKYLARQQVEAVDSV